ncbi:MAG TPA: ThuA domain-containing protein [Acidobacteriaceae bacterium]|nr:ThuA domain-containing protein [Acidobacteriaceae bacterium]
MPRTSAALIASSLAATLLTSAFALAQPPAAAQQRAGGGLDVADHREFAPPPTRGIDSKRWESWSAMRTAADPLLGWKIGMRSTDFPGASLEEALQKTDELALGNIEIFSTQKLDMDIPKAVNDTLYADELRAVKDKLIGINIVPIAYHVPEIPSDEASARKLFQFTSDLGSAVLVTEKAPASLDLVDKLAGEFKIKVAICGNPTQVLDAVKSHSEMLGVCGDTANWVQDGLKPADEATTLGTRLFILNLHDVSAAQGGHEVAPGEGVAGIPALLMAMYHAQIKPALMTVSGPPGDLAPSLTTFEEALRPVMTDRVDGISRTTAIRGEDKLDPADKAKIDAALPDTAPAKPRKPRKLLVMDLNVAYGGHRSIPAENYAIEQMGKRTGAYTVVFDDNLDNLKYPKIKQYDAIVLNNTVGMIFVDPEVRAGLLRFVREGGGLAGNHGTSHASMDWPEFHDMIGVTRGVHRANTEKCWIKIDDPKSPLVASFNGKEIEYEDEYFRFPNPPYSRTKLHVLLSIDVPKTDMNQGVVHVPGSSVSRPDADYAVSWIHTYGKGRVFFTILGHNPTLFESPELAGLYLRGLQFILGDLDADASPSVK